MPNNQFQITEAQLDTLLSQIDAETVPESRTVNIEDLKQAGFSDIEIRDHLAPSLKAAGFSDGEINAHFGRVESRGYLDTFATGLKHGVRGLPEAAGRAMQFVDRPGGLPWGDWGQSLVDVTERAREAHPEEERARELETLSEWHPKRWARALGEMAPLSLTAIPAGMAAASALPATAPLWVPTLIGAAVPGAVFGLSSGGQALELSREELTHQAIAAGENPEDPAVAARIESTSRSAANMDAVIEGFGEFASNIPIFAWMKIGKALPTSQGLKAVLKAPGWKGFLKNLGIVTTAEISTEVGQNIGQNISLKKHGVLPDQPWQEGIGEAFGATLLLSVFLSGGAHTFSEARRKGLVKSLENRNADPKKRLRAAGAVAAQMKAVDPELGETWFEEAASLISRKLPISTQLEHYVKKPSEIKKEGEGKIEPMASPGGAVKDIAEELTPKPMPEDLIPGEIPGIWPKAPAPEPMTSGLSGDELSQMSFEHFQPEMGEVSITEPPMADPLAIARQAEELLETQQIELPGFTERGFTMQQETEMQALNDEEAKMERRLDNLNAVPIKTKKIRQMIIEATDRLEQIETRRNEIQLERLQVLQMAVQARQAEVVPPEPAAPEVVPPPISVEASAPVGMETVITEDQLDDLFDQIAAEEEVGEVPAKPSQRAVTIQMPKEIMAISGTESIKNAIDSMRAMAKTGANKNEYGMYLLKEGDLAAIEDFVAEIEDFVISKGGTPGDVGGIKDYALGDLAADPKTNINTQSKGIWKPVDDWRKIVGELTEEVPPIRMITKRKDDVVVSFEGRVPSAAMSKLMNRFEQLSEYEGYSSGFAIDENIHSGDTNVGIRGISESKIKELLGIRKIEKKISAAKPKRKRPAPGHVGISLDKPKAVFPPSAKALPSGTEYVKITDRPKGAPELWTDGHIIALGKPPKGIAASEQTGPEYKSVLEQHWQPLQKAIKPENRAVTLDAELSEGTGKVGKAGILTLPDGLKVGIDPRYVGWFKSQWPDARFYAPTREESQVITVASGDKVVGGIMSQRMGTGELGLRTEGRVLGIPIEAPFAKPHKAAAKARKAAARKVIGKTVTDAIAKAKAEAPDVPTASTAESWEAEILTKQPGDFTENDFATIDEAVPWSGREKYKWEGRVSQKELTRLQTKLLKKSEPSRSQYKSVGYVTVESSTGDKWSYDIINTKEALEKFEKQLRGKQAAGVVMLSVEKFKAENFNDRLVKDVFRSALEEVLPKSLAKMTDIRLAEVIKANKMVLKSLQQHGYSEQEAFDIMAGRGPIRIIGKTQFLETGAGFVPVVSFAYHASLKTVYHEGFHVAMKMVMPEHAVDRVIKHYGNEEEAAKAFADFVLKQKGERTFKHPTWVRRVWDRLIAFSKAIISGFKKKGLDNVDDVFRALMNKKYARLSRAEVAERIDRAEAEAQLEVAAMDPAASVIDDYANKYISWEHKPERRSIKEIFHSLYTRVVDRMHPITNLTKIGEEQLKKDPVELTEEEYAKLSETEQWYYDYVRDHGELPAGMDPRILTRRFLGVIGIADTKLRSRKGAKDAIIELTPEGELEKVYDKTLEAILKDAVSLQDLMTYMVAERDIELSGRLSAYDQEIIGTHPEESRAVMDAIKAKHGDRFKDGIQDIANHIREWSDAVLLKPLLDVGALKQETYDKIKKANEFYIPYFRVMHELEAQGHVPKNANLFQPKSIPIKVIRGSHKQIVNPIESLITMAYRVADFTERARVAGSVAKMRLLSPEIAELIYKVKPKFIPHRVLLKEELDPVMMGQISKVVGAMGSTIETLHSIGKGTLGKFIKYMNQMGVTLNDKIQRRFASTERTLSHELGHLIDDRFDLQRLLMATPEMKKELRKIADQRAGEGASSYYLKYIRKKEEQVAEFVNRYINAPDQVKEMAPKAFEAFEKFCKGHKELELIPQIQLSGQATLVPFEAKIWTRSPFTPEKDTIMVFEDGAKHYYKVPHDVFEAMESMSSHEMNFITKILGAPARWLRAGATLTFEFMTRNPLRDVVSAWAYGSRTGFGLRDWFRGFASTIKQDEHFRDWEAAGGPFSMLVSLDRARTQISLDELTGKKNKLVKYAKNPIEALRLLSEAMEKTTRVGVYRAAINKGLTPAQAMKEARDSTLDFARHGQNMRFVNQIIAFWNANVQGMDKLVRETVTAKERAQTIKRIVMGITLPSIGLWLMNHDDERYKELPSWQKNLFWIIICGKDGPIIRIPKPFELGIIFGSLVERFLDHVYEKDPKALQGAWEAMVQGASPGIIPTGLAPIIESAANYSFFLERPIEDEGIKRLPVEMRYKPWTTETAKLAGKLLNVSPVKLENWVRSWTGGLGVYAMKGLDYPLAMMGIKPKTKLKEEGILKKIPGIKGLIAREPIGSASESVNRFYENMEGISEAEQGLRSLHAKRDLEGYKAFRKEHPEYRFAKRTRKTEKRLADLRSKKQRLYESDAPEEEKREKIKALNRRMTEIARAFNKWYGQKLEELKSQKKKPLAGEYVTGTWVNSYRQQANP